MGNNKLMLIAGGLVVVTFILVMVIFLNRGFGPKDGIGQRISLEFWGVFDDPEVFREVFDNYRRDNPNADIIYKKFSFEDYEKKLINAFASGEGPDIFMIQNTWLPRYLDKIAPLPQNPEKGNEPLFTLKSFREQFVDAAEESLVQNGEIYSLPLYVDTLALYYNKDLFNSLGITNPPGTWGELNELVEKITTSDSNNNILRSGAALGTARNINRSTDILSLLMLQSGVPMVDDDKTSAEFSNISDGEDLGRVALEYYTDFANPSKRIYAWNGGLHYSIDAFQEGSVAMMFNYSHQIPVLRSKAPRLNFSVAPVPQVDINSSVNYANFWSPTVSKFSNSNIQAWKFLAYLASAKGAVPYLNNTLRPSARRDLIEQQKNDPDLGVFAKQALSARSWYQIDSLAVEEVLADMIEDVNFSRMTVANALRSAENKITLLMQRK